MDLEALIAEVEQSSSGDEPLDRLAAAARRHDQLTDQADHLLDHFVQAAREANCSWAQIGEVLGVTKQAAQQRHGSRWRAFYPAEMLRSFRGRRAGLFQRFTPRARNSVVNAQEVARALGHTHVGTGHVLIGLLRTSDGVAAKALARWSLTPGDIQNDVEQRLGRSDEVPTGHLRFDADAKKTLELALREALQLGHNYIGTEHMLLGLIRINGGLAVTILRDRDIDPDEVRLAVLEEVAALEDEPPPADQGESEGGAEA